MKGNSIPALFLLFQFLFQLINLELKFDQPVGDGIGDMYVIKKRAIQLSLKKNCSVGATIAGVGTITHSYRIVEE